MREELLHTVTQAVKALKLQYRNVLTLRCFQQLSYAQIGQIMGQSELSTRMLFFRAKQSLTRQLARDGFKPSHLLPGLSLFAAATLAPSETAAAAVVSQVALHTGLLVKILTCLSTAKVALGITGVGALSAVTWGFFLMQPDSVLPFHQASEEHVRRIDPAYPTAIVNAYDPDQSGWQGALVRDEHTERAHRPVDMTLEQWINHPAGPQAAWIHLAREHWLELDFGTEIVDGVGDDVFVMERCSHGEAAEVYLVNPAGQLCLLGSLQVRGTGDHMDTIYGFDLADLPQPFPAHVVRIRCTANGFAEYESALPGMELLHVRVRTH
jgi:hypothetical protein